MKNLTIDEFEIMLEATGYLPPSNEDELAFFDQVYEDYKPRTEDRHVDVEEIVNGKCRFVSDSIHISDKISSSNSDVSECAGNRYSMAARNYSKLPKNVLDKMRRQHKLDEGYDE